MAGTVLVVANSLEFLSLGVAPTLNQVMVGSRKMRPQDLRSERKIGSIDLVGVMRVPPDR